MLELRSTLDRQIRFCMKDHEALLDRMKGRRAYPMFRPVIFGGVVPPWIVFLRTRHCIVERFVSSNNESAGKRKNGKSPVPYHLIHYAGGGLGGGQEEGLLLQGQVLPTQGRRGARRL